MKNLLRIFVIFLLISVTSCRHNSRLAMKSANDTILTAAERAARDSLVKGLQIITTDDRFRDATCGLIVYDFSGGNPKILYQHNATMGLIPASTQKILTTAAALEIFGPPVENEVFRTNQMSLNWLANRLLQRIGKEKYNKYDFTHGSQAVMEYWKDKGIDMNGLYICDGSGKSRNNTISPKQLADILYKMTFSPVFPVFYNSLPIAGLTGTMHKWLIGTPGEGRVHAKTGSLAGVRSYTGYVNTLSGKKLIFALIVNNYTCQTKELKKKLEQVMLAMVHY
jgi:D-alanyl-D-alanine carboxypeptidase